MKLMEIELKISMIKKKEFKTGFRFFILDFYFCKNCNILFFKGVRNRLNFQK